MIKIELKPGTYKKAFNALCKKDASRLSFPAAVVARRMAWMSYDYSAAQRDKWREYPQQWERITASMQDAANFAHDCDAIICERVRAAGGRHERIEMRRAVGDAVAVIDAGWDRALGLLDTPAGRYGL